MQKIHKKTQKKKNTNQHKHNYTFDLDYKNYKQSIQSQSSQKSKKQKDLKKDKKQKDLQIISPESQSDKQLQVQSSQKDKHQKKKPKNQQQLFSYSNSSSSKNKFQLLPKIDNKQELIFQPFIKHDKNSLNQQVTSQHQNSQFNISLSSITRNEEIYSLVQESNNFNYDKDSYESIEICCDQFFKYINFFNALQCIENPCNVNCLQNYIKKLTPFYELEKSCIFQLIELSIYETVFCNLCNLDSRSLRNFISQIGKDNKESYLLSDRYDFKKYILPDDQQDYECYYYQCCNCSLQLCPFCYTYGVKKQYKPKYVEIEDEDRF